MSGLISTFRAGSHTLSLMLGGGVIALAAATLTSRFSVQAITLWLQQIFGLTFLVLLGGLIFTSLFCWVRLRQSEQEQTRATWLEAGLQAANGITTLALTYTLLGISLGIGSLADQALTPETVQPIIRSLTESFSLAFLTTVVGLPVSSILRALLLVTHARKAERYADERKEEGHEISAV
jgi:heme/copper-type cytochrome/quinol oxidase subunit 2